MKINIHGDQKVSVHLHSVYSNNPHTIDGLKIGHYGIHSECGPCYTKHGLPEHSSACQ